MPYAIHGSGVYKKSGKLVGKSRHPKRYLHVLQAIEHGWQPPKKKRKRRK